MIEYVLYNEPGERPQLQKVVTVGETSIPTNLNPKNKDELDNIDDAVVTQHMNNLLDYTKSIAQEMEVWPDDEAANHTYPIKGLQEVMESSDEVCQWWAYLWRLSETRGMPIAIDDEMHLALHQAETPHMHHPDSGEIFYSDAAPDHEHDSETGDPTYPEAPVEEEEVVE